MKREVASSSATNFASTKRDFARCIFQGWDPNPNPKMGTAEASLQSNWDLEPTADGAGLFLGEVAVPWVL
ncbi:hypothetical protein N7494_003692 [Penicillium frequentans]|uniref:Uncharacterized protein n=1 Tax=Penicillium frequentans TaxID=3151616 RepID=A0AAD6CZG4_9EURO|nr:hypothetical protein N7494_003692 [Penicillium glabrum]